MPRLSQRDRAYYDTQRYVADQDRMGKQAYGKGMLAQAGSGLGVAKTEAKWRKVQASASRLGAYTGAVQTGMQIVTFVKPFIVGALILFLVMGPGLAAVINILGAMNWWMWLGAMVIGIMVWRNF